MASSAPFPDGKGSYRILNMKRRISSLISAVIFLAFVWIVLDRMRIVMWVDTPWWAFLLMGLVLFLVIDFAISRIFRNS